MGAGVFATVVSAFFFAACRAGVVTRGSGNAARAGCDVADTGDVIVGFGAGDALVAVGEDGAVCPRPTQTFSPRIAAATRQICAADINISLHPSLRLPKRLMRSAPARFRPIHDASVAGCPYIIEEQLNDKKSAGNGLL